MKTVLHPHHPFLSFTPVFFESLLWTWDWPDFCECATRTNKRTAPKWRQPITLIYRRHAEIWVGKKNRASFSTMSCASKYFKSGGLYCWCRINVRLQRVNEMVVGNEPIVVFRSHTENYKARFCVCEMYRLLSQVTRHLLQKRNDVTLKLLYQATFQACCLRGVVAVFN